MNKPIITFQEEAVLLRELRNRLLKTRELTGLNVAEHKVLIEAIEQFRRYCLYFGLPQ